MSASLGKKLSVGEGRLDKLEEMTGPQREEVYFKWLEQNPQPQHVITKNPDGSTTWQLK